MEYTILITTDSYGMGINNPDIKLVIQWDIPVTFDAMIQRMGCAKRKGGQATFILITPKWTILKDEKEIEQRAEKRVGAIAKEVPKSMFSNLNRPKIQTSPLSQIVTADEVSDTESITGFEQEFDQPDTENLLLLATEGEDEMVKKKNEKKANKSDAEKRANLSNEIFDYIHVAPCRRLFLLAWYDDMTYAKNADGSMLSLPTFCCNGHGCNSTTPDFLSREDFIDVSPVTYTEVDQEWVAC